jgi:hypothetical protein
MTTIEPQIVPPGVVTQEFRTPGTVRRGVVAGVVGNMLEWYDFALFGFFAKQIGAHFFPASNPTASLLAAYGTFAAGFLMRPGVYLSAASALAFVAAILLPKTLPHRLTTEFHSVRSAEVHTPPA